MAGYPITGAVQPCVQPIRASRSKNWPVFLASVRVSMRFGLHPRGRLTPTVERLHLEREPERM